MEDPPFVGLTQPMDPEKKFELYYPYPTKYVIPKSLKFSHWPSKRTYFLFEKRVDVHVAMVSKVPHSLKLIQTPYLRERHGLPFAWGFSPRFSSSMIGV